MYEIKNVKYSDRRDLFGNLILSKEWRDFQLAVALSGTHLFIKKDSHWWIYSKEEWTQFVDTTKDENGWSKYADFEEVREAVLEHAKELGDL